MRHALGIAVVLAVALVAAGGTIQAQEGPRVSAIYKTANVSQSGDHYSMSFTVRLTSMSDEDQKFDLVKLADRANAHSFARWESVSLPKNGKVELSDSITITANEYKLWKKGGPATLWIVTPDPMSTTRATAVSATLQKTGW